MDAYPIETIAFCEAFGPAHGGRRRNPGAGNGTV